MFNPFIGTDSIYDRVTFGGGEEMKASKLVFIQDDWTVVLGVEGRTVHQSDTNPESWVHFMYVIYTWSLALELRGEYLQGMTATQVFSTAFVDDLGSVQEFKNILK